MATPGWQTAWSRRLVRQLGQVRSDLDIPLPTDTRPESLEAEAVSIVVHQMLSRPFTLIGKGINTNVFDDRRPGLRTRVARKFGNSTGLALFVLRETIKPERSSLTTEMLESAALALLDPEATHEDVILQLGSAYFESVCDDPCLTLQTFAWLAARESPELRESFQALYDSLGSRLVEGLDFFLDSWARVPIDGVSVADITTALTSLVEGLAMRTAVDPDSVPEQLAARSMLALLEGSTRTAEELKAPL